MVVYLLNHGPTKSLNSMMLYEAWHGKKLPMQHLLTFMCVVYDK